MNGMNGSRRADEWWRPTASRAIETKYEPSTRLSDENKMEVHDLLRIICLRSVERHDYPDSEADLLAPKSRIPVWTIGPSRTHGLLARY